MNADILYDIETLPDLSVSAVSIVKAARAGRVKAYPRSKAETIDKWVADAEPATLEEAWRRGAVQRLNLRILAIAVAVDEENEGEIKVLHAEYPARAILLKLPMPERVAVLDKAEGDLLRALDAHLEAEAVYELGNGAPRWVTYNGNGFDHTAVWIRAIKYGIKGLALHVPHDKWGKKSLDLADTWKGTDYRGRMNRLTEIVQYLGGPPQEGIEGAGVYDAWNSGRLEEVLSHVSDDIHDLRFVMRRLMAVRALW